MQRSRSHLLIGCVGLVGLAVGCRLEIDTPLEPKTCEILDIPACMAATPHSDFAFIQKNILGKNCIGSACHENRSTNMKAGVLRFDDPVLAYTTLVGSDTARIESQVEPGVLLVDPPNPNKSYLLFLMHGVAKADFDPPGIGDPPSDVGYMPRGNATLCCQKIEAIERWIVAGALDDSAPP